MTPEQEALREKVARNIERALQVQDFGHWADDGGFICTVEQAERLAACCDDAAADAIAVVLKEAARVAYDIDADMNANKDWPSQYQAGFDTGCIDTCRAVSAAILSLIPQEEGE